jgi:hypothetical protein
MLRRVQQVRCHAKQACFCRRAYRFASVVAGWLPSFADMGATDVPDDSPDGTDLSAFFAAFAPDGAR